MSVQKVNMQLVNLLRPFFVSWKAYQASNPIVLLSPSVLSTQTGISAASNTDFALSAFGIPSGARMILGSVRCDYLTGSVGAGLSIYLENRAAAHDLLIGGETIDSNNWAIIATPIAFFVPQSSTNLRFRWSGSSAGVSDPADISFRAYGYIM